MLKVYVAGASDEVARAERAIARLRGLGVEITHDWTPDVRAVAERAAGPLSLEDQERLERARVDVEAVRRADLVLFLAPDPPLATTGGGFEIGVAYILGKPVVVAGSHAARRRFLFGVLLLEVESDDAAIWWITDPNRTVA